MTEHGVDDDVDMVVWLSTDELNALGRGMSVTKSIETGLDLPDSMGQVIVRITT